MVDQGNDDARFCRRHPTATCRSDTTTGRSSIAPASRETKEGKRGFGREGPLRGQSIRHSDGLQSPILLYDTIFCLFHG
jgi:hypothetical protein